MSKKTIWFRTGVPKEDPNPFYERVISELCQALTENLPLSPREEKIWEYAENHGEVYHGELEEHEDGSFSVSIDCGQPEDVIKVTFPKFYEKNKAIRTTQEIVESYL